MFCYIKALSTDCSIRVVTVMILMVNIVKDVDTDTPTNTPTYTHKHMHSHPHLHTHTYTRTHTPHSLKYTCVDESKFITLHAFTPHRVTR